MTHHEVGRAVLCAPPLSNLKSEITMKRNRRNLSDPAQTEMFAVVWFGELARPFRLHAGDVIRVFGKLGRVLRVNYSCAVVIVNSSPREFTTRFDKPVRFQQPPATHRISPNSEIEILNR